MPVLTKIGEITKIRGISKNIFENLFLFLEELLLLKNLIREMIKNNITREIVCISNFCCFLNKARV